MKTQVLNQKNSWGFREVVAVFLASLVATVLSVGASSVQAATKVVIESRPASLTVDAGQQARFDVKASGTGPLAYQWYKNGKKISGATATYFLIPSVRSTDAGYFQVRVSNSVSVNWTGKAYLEVDEPEVKELVILSRPNSQTIITGDPVSFGVVAEGTGELSYQWYKNGSKILGATSVGYTIPAVSSGDAGYYQVKVSDANTVNWTGKAYLTVEQKPVEIVPLEVVSRPASVTVGEGANAQFTVVAKGTGTLSYQWYKNGQKMEGATQLDLNLASVAKADEGYFQVRIQDEQTFKWTGKAYLTVEAAPVEATPELDVVISLQPMGGTAYAGSSYTLNVAASGTGALKYQWRKDGQPLSGAVLPHLTLSGLSQSDAGIYDVVVSNETGALVSELANLSVVVDRAARLSWKAPATRVDGSKLNATDLSMYLVYHSNADGSLDQVYEVQGGASEYVLTGLTGGEHFFAVTAVDANGYESDLSAMGSKVIYQ